MGTFKQIIEKNGSEKKELLERKTCGIKRKIGAALDLIEFSQCTDFMLDAGQDHCVFITIK